MTDIGITTTSHKKREASWLKGESPSRLMRRSKEVNAKPPPIQGW